MELVLDQCGLPMSIVMETKLVCVNAAKVTPTNQLVGKLGYICATPITTVTLECNALESIANVLTSPPHQIESKTVMMYVFELICWATDGYVSPLRNCMVFATSHCCLCFCSVIWASLVQTSIVSN